MQTVNYGHFCFGLWITLKDDAFFQRYNASYIIATMPVISFIALMITPRCLLPPSTPLLMFQYWLYAFLHWQWTGSFISFLNLHQSGSLLVQQDLRKSRIESRLVRWVRNTVGIVWNGSQLRSILSKNLIWHVGSSYPELSFCVLKVL